MYGINVTMNVKKLSLILMIVSLSGTQEGYTPLHLSSREGHTEVVDILLNKGANPHAVSKVGFIRLCLCTLLLYL